MRDAGRDASDFLADNPDLNRDILDLGKRMGLPGFEDAKPYVGANLTAAPAEAAPGAEVILTAAGLPARQNVVLGFWPPGGDQRCSPRAASTDRGTFEQAVTVPDLAKPGETAVFTVETADGRVRLISEPVTILAPGPPPGHQDQRQRDVVERGCRVPRAPRRRRQALHARRTPGRRLQARRSRPCGGRGGRHVALHAGDHAHRDDHHRGRWVSGGSR